ncbi:winged helix-turn-helix transcriptional regulator [Natrialbaceae archaeon AArc-T1-2]|uniref:winged helix-turn-helix transcriptional regulator n=1 Tax=Natrialbaceae archaeon AArc-T1-2 TaxID=3053904 RepID=UPI00255ACDB6|nr:winged helix-turn-helix transcriptional regulator [Natrialbaceae archaeon AArc-T1-2]WIV67081.1 winged helix-turn-helix transcriptional regulator [Natrialbaceae archaeon AArc-T1-2]
MSTLDETDLEILRLLVEDARRPYSDIAERVDRSAPTVSDRIDRLEELGVIERFTVDLDRSTITDGVEVLVDLDLQPGADDGVSSQLAETDWVEHVIETADSRLLAVATVQPTRARALLGEAVDLEAVESYRIHLIEQRRWSPSVGDADLALECAECGNPVTSNGDSVVIDGERYHFCCPVCRSSFEERYASLSESA